MYLENLAQRKEGGVRVAERVYIKAEENAVHIIVDGNEINDVLSYVLSEDQDGAKLTIEIFITGKVEALIE